MPSVDAESGTRPAGARPAPTAGRWGRTPLIFVTAMAVVAIDQLTKLWAVDTLKSGRVIHLVGSLQLGLHYNTGSAFSIGENLGPIIGVLAVVVVIVLAFTGRSARNALTAVTVGLLIGGALGNLADRAFRSGLGTSGFFHGAVVDFIDLQWWPVFNVADAAISVGAILLVLTGFRADPKAPPPASSAGP